MKNTTIVTKGYYNTHAILHSISNGTNDMAVHMTVARTERRDVFPFLWYLATIHPIIGLRRSSAMGITDIFMQKFYSGGLIIATSIFIAVFFTYSKKKFRGLSNVWFWAMAIASQQGSEDTLPTRQRSGIYLLVISSAFGMVVLNIYTASLASDIAKQVPAINSIQELEESGFKYIATPADLKRFGHRHFLEENPLFVKMAAQGHSLNMSGSHAAFYKVIVEHLAPGEDNKLFFASTTSSIGRSMEKYGLVEQDILTIGAKRTPESPLIIDFAFGRNFQNNRKIVMGFVKMQEAGLMEKVEALWLGAKILRSSSESPSFQSADIIQVKSAFLLWSSGVTVALLIFLGELVWKLCQGKGLQAGTASDELWAPKAKEMATQTQISSRMHLKTLRGRGISKFFIE